MNQQILRNYWFIIICIVIAPCCQKNNAGINNPPPPPPPPEVKIPVVSTGNISNLTRYSVILSGVIKDTGKATINQLGFVVDTVPNPTIARNMYQLSLSLDSTETFSVTVNGFPANTTFFVRAYCGNPYGIGYGNDMSFNSFRENIYNGDVSLATQQQVNDFGSKHYDRINGGLTIDGPVTDLRPLKSLVVVNNGVIIRNTMLTDFSGLDSLEYTGYIFPNSFRVEYNQKLTSFSGLSRLRISRGYFYIINNPALLNLDGLNSFEAVGTGELRIQDCEKLQNINGLGNLVFVGYSVYLVNNPALTDIQGFSNLATIGERLYIINNASLQSLDGLEQIRYLPRGVEITGNSLLSDLDGLGNLAEITDGTGQGAITINGNPMLNNLSAFSRITKADYVYIQHNQLLSDLAGFNNLESVTHFLHIEDNPGLTDLSGLEKLTTVGRLEIVGNASLQNLQGVNSLLTIEGNDYAIGIASNDQLLSLSGLENVIYAEGSIQVSNNKALADFCALKTLFLQGYNQFFFVENNAVNPAMHEIITNCP